jgi:hypothetical protein
VTGVTLVLDDGSTVHATVANGWFAAWWPASQRTQSRGGQSLGQALARMLAPSVPRYAEISAAGGTSTQPLNWNNIERTTQSLSPEGTDATSSTGPSGSTGATGTTGSNASGASGGSAALATPSTDPELESSFAVLRQPVPSAVPLPADRAGAFTGPAEPPNPYGIDPGRAQYVAAANTWVLPGSSGVCLFTVGLVGPGVGSGSCDSTLTAVSGDFLVFSKRWPTNEIAYVGLAPDGNATVAVTDADGATRQVPVTDNVYVVIGGNPRSITLRDASGVLTSITTK